MRCFLLMILAVFPSLTVRGEEAFAPEFYPFENGVKFGSVAEGAKAMKEMGYDGVGSVHANVLESFLKEFDAVGLKVFSIYVGGKVGADSYSYSPAVTKAIRRSMTGSGS